MVRLALASVLALSSLAAHAGEMTAGLLYAYCKDQYNLSQEACRFYIQGVADSVSRPQAGKPPRFCPPKALPIAELVGAFYRRVEAVDRIYPQDVTSPAATLLAETLAERFPCRGARS